MKNLINVGEIFVSKNGTIFRISKKWKNKNKTLIKLRCIRPCSGKYSKKERIGKPYTYQRIVDIKKLKNCERIGTEELLHILFYHKNNI